MMYCVMHSIVEKESPWHQASPISPDHQPAHTTRAPPGGVVRYICKWPKIGVSSWRDGRLFLLLSVLRQFCVFCPREIPDRWFFILPFCAFVSLQCFCVRRRAMEGRQKDLVARSRKEGWTLVLRLCRKCVCTERRSSEPGELCGRGDRALFAVRR